MLSLSHLGLKALSGEAMHIFCRCSLAGLFALTVVASHAQVIRVEAETATLTGPDVRVVGAPAATPQALAPTTTKPSSAPLKFSGGGYITGFTNTSDHATLQVVAKNGGLYRLSAAYHCQGKRGYDISVNGLSISGIFASSSKPDFSVQDMGEVELNAGSNELTINRGWGYVDYDYFDLTSLGTPPAPRMPSALPADADVSPAARALLLKLDHSFGKTTLMGVYSNQDADYVLKTTGVRPAIMGGDLIDYSPQRANHQQKPNHEIDRLIADAKDGYLLTLSWHWASPSGQMNTEAEPWWKSFYTEATTYDVSQVLANPNSKEYALMLSDIDTIAVQLRKLQDAGIPVLWRPLHEASGGWFWWGAKGPKAFIQLWQIVFDRLTKVDGIHNLLWVYTGDGDPLWYPGDKYVDVIGLDEYPKDLRDPQSNFWDVLQQQHEGSKIVTISEFGGVPDVPRMQRMGEYWSYAVSWSGGEGPRKNTPEEVQRIYSSAGVTTLPAPAAAQQP